jgi:uncharacterized membrane protein YfcA
MDVVGAISPAYAAAGLGVGILVGLTGVGGGALMTPLLVLLFGVRINTAVGTDLLFAAATKSVGVSVHGRSGSVDWRITGLMALGSLPAAAATIAVLHITRQSGQPSSPLLTAILGGSLVVTAICLVGRRWIDRLVAARPGKPLFERPAAATIALGAVIGVLVTITSVGAGAIGMTVLVLLYPRVPLVKLVGSDIAHAVPLTLLAGAGYWLLGVIDWPLLRSLLVGSIPGIVIGSRLASRVPEAVLRPILAAVLLVVGLRMF